VTIELSPHADGVALSIKAQPGARRNGVTGEHNGALKVSVSQAPDKGKANRAVAQTLRQQLDLRPGQLELISGETSREKRFLVRGIATAELAARIAALLASVGRT